jgi:hypothetical protein
MQVLHVASLYRRWPGPCVTLRPCMNTACNDVLNNKRVALKYLPVLCIVVRRRHGCRRWSQ